MALRDIDNKGGKNLDFQSQDKSSWHFLEKIKLQWMATLDAISEPIAIIDKDYTIQKSNKAMAAMSSHGDVKKLIGEKCYQVFAGLDEPCKGCTAMKSLVQKQPLEFTYERASDGKTFEISSYPVLDEDAGGEEVSGVVQVYRDRTLQIKMEERIRQHDKITSLGLLAGGIAHEVNNPLSGVLLFSQMLLKEMDAGHDHYQDVIEIESAAQRCKEIIQQILDFSRQSPTVLNKSEKTALEDTISQAMRFAQVLKSAKDCRVFYEWQDRNVEVYGSRGRLVQVFLNLFKNAFQAMPDGGELYVIQSHKNVGGKAYVEIEIKDSGLGITKEDLPKIFDPFYTTKSVEEGTGLGLAICYGLIKELGGDIRVESELGKSTSFFVTLPSCSQGGSEDPKSSKGLTHLRVL